jgi:hypothetical protein
MKLRPCSSETFKHNWAWVKNTVTKTQTLRTINYTERGVYRCATCKEVKFGPMRSEQ